jgi:hypothetical protein
LPLLSPFLLSFLKGICVALAVLSVIPEGNLLFASLSTNADAPSFSRTWRKGWVPQTIASLRLSVIQDFSPDTVIEERKHEAPRWPEPFLNLETT